LQVRSDLTSLALADVSVISTDMPGVWVSADHRCVVWCKQLVLALNRALFDVIDGKTRQVNRLKCTGLNKGADRSGEQD
jgi:glycosylphosphatidylinositol deacylase